MKIVIVGGVAGGASAAARIRRLDEHADIVLFERGGEVSYANCGMPYYLGGVIEDEDELLLQTPESFWERFRVRVCTHREVTAIDREKKCVSVRDLESGDVFAQDYDVLVLSPGGKAFLPPVAGIDLPCVYSLRSMRDMEDIAEKLHNYRNGGSAVVVGGGFIGIEMAENLQHRGIAVTLIEAADQVFSVLDAEMAAMVQQELASNGVRVLTSAPLVGIEKTHGGCEVICGEGTRIPCDFVITAIGILPESKLAKDAGLAVNARGGILVDAHMRTSDSHIYAAGDAVEVTNLISECKSMLPLAGPANRQGRVIAANIAGLDETFTGVVGSSVVKVFSYTAAATGMNERALKDAGMDYEKVYLFPQHHAGYYPGGKAIAMKLLFARDGRVLGCQCVGEAGVEKRVDVVATVIQLHGKVSDLARLELCYAPPYSSAKDPVNYAGFLAENVLSGRSPIKHWHDLANRDRAASVLLDVRTAGEYAAGHLPDSLHIPLDELRERIQEIPTDREIWVYCQVGLRGYLAQRILLQRTKQQVYNLSGGYRLLMSANLLKTIQ